MRNLRLACTITAATCLLAPDLHAGPQPTATPKATPTATSDLPQAEAATTPKPKDKPKYSSTQDTPAYEASVDTSKTTSIPALAIGSSHLLAGVDRSLPIDAAGLWPVHQYDATHTTTPGAVSLVRAGNHTIARPAWGGQVKLSRVVPDADGSVFVWYTTPNTQGGQDPHIRKILADNQLGFDKPLLLEPHAGITPDGAGGVHVVTHKGVASDGEFYYDLTAHTSTRFDATGTIVWQRAEPTAPKPHSDAQHWSSAARSNQGVYVGYGVKVGANQLTPVLIHRKTSDGSKVYTRTGLKAPTNTGGAPGSAPLYGAVDRIWKASDGTAIASVHDGTANAVLVRLDTGGNQTAAFACPGLSPTIVAHTNGTVACIATPTDGTIVLSQYGVSAGTFKQLATWTSAPIAGWDFGELAVGPGGQVLAAAATPSGHAGLALFSATGVLLRKVVTTGRKGKINALAADADSWLGMQFGDDASHTLVRGTYAPGSG